MRTEATEEDNFYTRLRWSVDSYAEFNYLGVADWVEPKKYYIGEPDARVEGNIGFIGGNAQELKFRVFLPEGILDQSNIPWSILKPFCIEPGSVDGGYIELRCNPIDIAQ